MTISCRNKHDLNFSTSQKNILLKSQHKHNRRGPSETVEYTNNIYSKETKINRHSVLEMANTSNNYAYFATYASLALILLASSMIVTGTTAFVPSKAKRAVSRAFPFFSTTTTPDDRMPKLPEGVVKYSQVPKDKEFTATTIPKGLLKQHTTRKGTWGIINVSQGSLEYKITASESDDGTPKVFQLDSEKHGIIEPQKLHQVSPLSDDVKFVVEFLRLPGTGPVNEQREGL